MSLVNAHGSEFRVKIGLLKDRCIERRGCHNFGRYKDLPKAPTYDILKVSLDFCVVFEIESIKLTL